MVSMSEPTRGSLPPEEQELPANERPADTTPPSPPPAPSPRADADDGDTWQWKGQYSKDWHHKDWRHKDWGRDRSPLSTMTWGSMLILAGLVFLADMLGLLPQWSGADPWSWIMLGAGGLLLLNAFVRAVLPDYGEPSFFHIVGGLVLVALGAGQALALNLSFDQWWPVILIALGLSALLRGFRR